MELEKWKKQLEAFEAELDERLAESGEEELARLTEKAAALSEAIEADEPEDPESEEYYQWMLLLDAAEACLEELQDAAGE